MCRETKEEQRIKKGILARRGREEERGERGSGKNKWGDGRGERGEERGSKKGIEGGGTGKKRIKENRMNKKEGG